MTHLTANQHGVCPVGWQESITKELTVGWEEVGGGREVQEGGAYVHLWLIHVDEWQKSNQHCKAIILQLKRNKKQKANKIIIIKKA